MFVFYSFYIDNFVIVFKDFRGWRLTVDSKSYYVKNKRVVDETEGLLLFDELVRIKKSRCYNNVIRLFVLVGKGKELSNSEFVFVRDFFFIRFFLDIGIRFGSFNNAIMDKYMKGKVDDGRKVMLVVKYKRVKDGFVICLMLLEFYKFMEVYRRNIRLYFVRLDE